MAQLDRVGSALMEGTAKILAAKGVESAVLGRPAMFSFYFGDAKPADYRGATSHDEDFYENLVMAMIERGVMPSPDALEPWFLSAAHSDEDVATTLQVFEESLVEALG